MFWNFVIVEFLNNLVIMFLGFLRFINFDCGLIVFIFIFKVLEIFFLVFLILFKMYLLSGSFKSVLLFCSDLVRFLGFFIGFVFLWFIVLGCFNRWFWDFGNLRFLFLCFGFLSFLFLDFVLLVLFVINEGFFNFGFIFL